MRNYSLLRISFDNQTILNNLLDNGLAWNQSMDLIHLSISSRLDITKSLQQYLDLDLSIPLSVKKSILWLLSSFADDAISQLPELPEDMCWETIREYDLEIQTWVIAVPLIVDNELPYVAMTRFKRYLENEEIEGNHVPLDVYKHVESYTSTLLTRRALHDRNNKYVGIDRVRPR